METIQWYQYISAFFAGLFLTNVIPHFVQGVSGNKFPTPFSKPPGKGLSSPLINTLWACLNLLIGYLLFHVSEISSNNKILMIVFFVGIMLMSCMLSVNFAKKDKE